MNKTIYNKKNQHIKMNKIYNKKDIHAKMNKMSI